MDNEQEIDFRDLIQLIQSGFLLALLVGTAAAAGAFFVSRAQEPVYQATSTLILSQPASNLGTFGVSLVTAPAIDVNAYRAAASSFPVVQVAMMLVDSGSSSAETIEDFNDRLSVRTQENRLSSMLYIDFRDSDPTRASKAANALAVSLVGWDEDRASENLMTIVSALEAQIVSLDSQLAELSDSAETASQRESIASLRGQQAVALNSARALLTSAVGSLEIMEPALPPSSPVSPRPVRNAALAFVLGVFLVYGLLLLRGALDTRIRDTEELQRITGVPVMAEFPVQTGIRRLPKEATSYLRTNLLFATADTDPKVFLVTGSHSDQGKSSVSLSLAESFTRNGYRTLLIDADMRRPVLHREYKLRETEQDLATFLQAPEEPLEPLTVPFYSGISMDVLPTFRPADSPTELLNRGMKRLLARLAPNYDTVIIDSAPMLPVADTLAIAPHATGVIFVVSMQEADKRGVGAAFELLGRLGINVLGTVMTNVPKRGKRRSGRGYGYGYGYGYGAGYGDESQDQMSVSTRRTRTSS